MHLCSLCETWLNLKTHTVSETESRTSCLTTVSQTITVSSCQSDISNQCRIKKPCITGMECGRGGRGGSSNSCQAFQYIPEGRDWGTDDRGRAWIRFDLHNRAPITPQARKAWGQCWVLTLPRAGMNRAAVGKSSACCPPGNANSQPGTHLHTVSLLLLQNAGAESHA